MMNQAVKTFKASTHWLAYQTVPRCSVLVSYGDGSIPASVRTFGSDDLGM